MSVPTEIITDTSVAENGFYWREKNGVKVLVCRPLEEKGFANGFSTRAGGVSDFPENSLNLSGLDIDSAENLAENRRRFLRIFDGDFRVATAWQVHGDDVKIVRENADIESDGKFDALASGLSNVLLGVKTADCVPVLLGDARTKCFAAIHAGWRGTAQSIVVKTAARMQSEFGTKPKDLTAAIGPAATCKNYEIGREVFDAFRENFADSERFFTATRDGHWLVDLHSANKAQLLSVGVEEANIFTAPLCTMERTDLFFSYRVERKIYGKTGRLLSVISRKN